MASKSKVKPKIPVGPVASSPLNSLVPLVGGTVAAMLIFAVLHFGAAQIWAPFAVGGPNVFKGLALSALACGLATAVLGRHLRGPLAAMACALGWALWGWSLHFGAQGKYLSFLPGGLPSDVPVTLIFSNAISQSLCVAFGLLIASAVSWLWMRRRKGSAFEAEEISDDDLAGNGLQSFGTALVYPLSTAIAGVALLMVFGLLALPLGEPPTRQLPSGPFSALWCDLLVLAALALATLGARRAFRALGSVGDVIIAPLTVAFVAGMWVAASGQMPIMRPAALLLWHTSGFEMASWAALGASLGYYFARAKAR